MSNQQLATSSSSSTHRSGPYGSLVNPGDAEASYGNRKVLPLPDAPASHGSREARPTTDIVMADSRPTVAGSYYHPPSLQDPSSSAGSTVQSEEITLQRRVITHASVDLDDELKRYRLENVALTNELRAHENQKEKVYEDAWNWYTRESTDFTERSTSDRIDLENYLASREADLATASHNFRARARDAEIGARPTRS